MHYPVLEVDLAALTRNYTLLKSRHPAGQCAAVVKANAYGLGVAPVSETLHKAGCREFFVATLEEAIELRDSLEGGTLHPSTLRAASPAGSSPAAPPRTTAATIYVFHGARKGEAATFREHNLVPVLNSLEQWQLWEKTLPHALHIDTGMTRLGVSLQESSTLENNPNLKLILSHLACANEPETEQNNEQLQQFRAALRNFKGVRASFANSSGIFLGDDYHFDLLRPGCSLYGISPNTKQKNPMEGVVTLTAPALQIRHIDQEQTVGYGGHGVAAAGSVLATVELGYADGFHRILSGRTQGFAHGVRLPLLGRVSMDMVSLDISAIAPEQQNTDLRVTFIGKEQTVDVLATAAGTIGYEILTGIGRRVKRVYKD